MSELLYFVMWLFSFGGFNKPIPYYVVYTY